MRAGLPSRVAHELRTPLGVLTTAHAQLAGLPPSDDTAARMLEMAQRATAQLIRIADRMSVLARAEHGFSAASLPQTELEPAARAAVDTVTRCRRRRNVTLELDDAPAWSAQVRADRPLLTFALAELVDNAVRYASARVVVSACAEGSTVQVRVRDDGPGIEAAARLHFGQGEGAPDAKSGLGVGTWLAREIARSFGGDLRVLRDAGPTEVALELPVVRI